MVSTVLLVDHHPRFRSRARRVLHATGFEVVGEAVDGRGALAAAAMLRPHVVLIELHLPDLDGIEVASRLAARADPPAVVLMSSADPELHGARLGGCGARGLIPKTRLSPDLLEAVLRGDPEPAEG